jgi:PhoPQ-activated pathogenicity-related protein
LFSGVFSTALDDYVNKPDPNYAWTDTGLRIDGDGLYTGYILNMTSQRWLTDADTTRSLWWHTMVVIVPRVVKHPDSSFVWITGGDNEASSPPKGSDEDILVTAYTAIATNTIGVALFDIPNQHMVFASDPKQQRRSEDAIIAFTWQHYINDPSQPEWLLRLPMTKAVVRAMDAAAEFTQRLDPTYALTDFYIAGASKRGWTTWTTAAVDSRVKAMAPIVMDELNFVENIHHHYRAYGGWTFALEDYYVLNFTKYIDDPRLAEMMTIVDPISYKDRFAGMPKMVCDAGGDEFFLPDDWRFWWDDMPEPKHGIMVPNAEHSMATGIGELLPAVATFFDAVLTNKTVPTVDWTIDNATGTITVHVSEEPSAVHVWHATTCNTARRDFRLINIDDPCTCGIAQSGVCVNLKVLWAAEKLEPSAPLTYTHVREPPADGRWVAFFIDVQFNSTAAEYASMPTFHLQDEDGVSWPIDPPGTFEFTSGVSILPNTYPFPPCSGAGCYGTLV